MFVFILCLSVLTACVQGGMTALLCATGCPIITLEDDDDESDESDDDSEDDDDDDDEGSDDDDGYDEVFGLIPDVSSLVISDAVVSRQY